MSVPTIDFFFGSSTLFGLRWLGFHEFISRMSVKATVIDEINKLITFTQQVILFFVPIFSFFFELPYKNGIAFGAVKNRIDLISNHLPEVHCALVLALMESVNFFRKDKFNGNQNNNYQYQQHLVIIGLP